MNSMIPREVMNHTENLLVAARAAVDTLRRHLKDTIPTLPHSSVCTIDEWEHAVINAADAHDSLDTIAILVDLPTSSEMDDLVKTERFLSDLSDAQDMIAEQRANDERYIDGEYIG